MDAPRSAPHTGSDTQPGPAPRRSGVLPPARPPLTKPSRPPAGFAVPTQTLQKYVRFLRRAPAPTPPFAHHRWWWLRVRSASRTPQPRGSRAAPTPTRRLPQLFGRGRPRRLRTSGPLHPLRSAQLPTNATRRRALRSSGEPREGRVGGGARRSRRPSRACRSHVFVRVTCSRRSQSRRTLSRSKEAVVRDRPRPEMFSSLAPAASGAVAAATETPAAAATRRSSFRG